MFAAEVVPESLPGDKEKIEQNGIHKNVEGIQIATGQDINSDIHSRLQDRDRNAKIPPHPRILREKGKEIQGFRREVAKIKTRSTGRELAPGAVPMLAKAGEEAKERRKEAQKEIHFFMERNLSCAADSAISVWSAARKDRAEGDSKKDRASGRLRHAEQQSHHENDGDVGENGMEKGFPQGGRALGRGAGDAEQSAFGNDLKQISE